VEEDNPVEGKCIHTNMDIDVALETNNSVSNQGQIRPQKDDFPDSGNEGVSKGFLEEDQLLIEYKMSITRKIFDQESLSELLAVYSALLAVYSIAFCTTLFRKRIGNIYKCSTRESNSPQHMNYDMSGSISNRYIDIITYTHALIIGSTIATVINNFGSIMISDTVSTAMSSGASLQSDEESSEHRAEDSRAGHESDSQVFTVGGQVRGRNQIPETIQYESLKAAAAGFDERKRSEGGRLIAAGSFGHVFWAMWKGIEVAIKRLKQPKSNRPSSVRLSKRQYMNELSVATSYTLWMSICVYITSIDDLLCRCPEHPNITRLIGISDDGPELLLVYEYVDGHTLAYHLVKVISCFNSLYQLEWSQIFNCQLYMHTQLFLLKSLIALSREVPIRCFGETVFVSLSKSPEASITYSCLLVDL
jgi:hypothetical protein